MSQMVPYKNYVPDEVRAIIEQVKSEMTCREAYSHQTRDYNINSPNGDRVNIHEVTQVWIRETG